jgi:hypothetical protein
MVDVVGYMVHGCTWLMVHGMYMVWYMVDVHGMVQVDAHG